MLVYSTGKGNPLTLSWNEMAVAKLVAMGDKANDFRYLDVQGTTYDPFDGKIQNWPEGELDLNLQMIAKIAAICNDADVEKAGDDKLGHYVANGMPTEAALKRDYVKWRGYLCFFCIPGYLCCLQPKEGVLVEARSESKCYYEERLTDSSGSYRLRGLLPDTVYVIEVGKKGDLDNQIERASPESVVAEVKVDSHRQFPVGTPGCCIHGRNASLEKQGA